MNKLTIIKSMENQTISYETEKYVFSGTCSLNENKEIDSINAQVSINSINIGSCSTNNSSVSINIWNADYTHATPSVAADFNSLLEDLHNKNSKTSINVE